MGRRKDIEKIIQEKIGSILVSNKVQKLNDDFLKLKEYVIETINTIYKEKKIDEKFIDDNPELQIEKIFYYEFLNMYRF